MQFDVHALQGFLHQLYATGGRVDVVGAQAQVVLQPADVGWRHKARSQQAVHVQRGAPLAVGHIGLPARQTARLAAIDHAHVQMRRLQLPVQGQTGNRTYRPMHQRKNQPRCRGPPRVL